MQKDNTPMWIIFGCIIPDLPWITARIVLPTHLVDPYNLRLYCTIQASLLFCLFFSATIACFARRAQRIFLILSGNCLFHLLLDSLQTKWGNGVHLFAPFSWKKTSFALIWPDHAATIICTCLGFFYLLFIWKKIVTNPLQLHPPTKGRISIGILFLVCYLAGPLFFLDGLEQTDFYSIHTLRLADTRPGKIIEFDRSHYDALHKRVTTFSGEQIRVSGTLPEKSGTVSIKGHFLTPDHIIVNHCRFHNNNRDIGSYLGLFMACILLLQSLIVPGWFNFRKKSLRNKPDTKQTKFQHRK